MKYYFLVAYLPELQRDDRKIKIGLTELISGQYDIPPEHMREIELILLGRDIFMVEKLLSGKAVPLAHSIYGLDFWRDQIKSPQEGPQFILDYIRGLEPGKYSPQDVDRLYGAYYDHAIAQSRYPFLKGYFLFERNLRNIIAALRARQKEWNLAHYLVGEDEWVSNLEKSSMEDFGLGDEYPWIGNLVSTDYPPQRQDLIEQIIWEYLETQVGNDPFHFNAILSYALKLEILEKKLSMSREKGMNIVRRLEEQ
jgi:hypothetical protein